MLLRQARRLVIAVVGGTVLLIGVAMLVLPGPAVVVIPAGLAILATEFVWARRLLRSVQDRLAASVRRARATTPPAPPSSGPPRDATR